MKHRLADSPYNERRERCEAAAAQLDGLLPHSVVALRDVSWEEFTACRDKIESVAARRAAHVIGEITRVEKGIQLLSDSRLDAFGQLLFESHQSSIDNFENSCPELDVVVEGARKAGALGARLSGGGFGGSAIAMVRSAEARAVGEAIQTFSREHGIEPDILEVSPSAGAHIVSACVQDAADG